MTGVNETVDGPSWPSRADADHAAERITERRTAARDEDLAQLRDDLLDVAAYVAARRAVNREILRQDIRDAWLILDHIQRQADLIRLHLITAATTTAGETYEDLAPMCGVTTRQGVEAIRRRLEAAAAGHPKDARYARDARARDHTEETEAARLTRIAGYLVGALRGVDGDLPGGVDDDLAEMADAITRGADRVLVARARLLVDELLEDHPAWLAEHPGLGVDLADYKMLLHGSTADPGRGRP